VLNRDKGRLRLGEKDYYLITRGIKQARQITELTNWLANFGVPVYEGMADKDGNIPQMSTAMFLLKAFQYLDEESLIGLYVLFVGCPKKTAEEHFDFGDLIEVIEFVWDNQPGIKRIVNRFFSTSQPSEVTEESIMT
jgi:hypothetical protein